MGITERVRALCDENGISMRKLERDLGIGNSTIRKWSINTPNADVLQKTARYFGVTVGYLLGESDDREVEYYIDPEVSRIAQDMKDRPELKVLFDASRDLSETDIEFVLDMIERMK